MRIVTLNTWKNEGEYERRLDLMAVGLGDLRADVVCLQECFVGGGSDTAARLAAALGMRAYPAPARRKLRAHGGRRVMSTSGLAVLTRERVTEFDLCALDSAPGDGQRIAQRVDVDRAGASLRILNLHLTHLGGGTAERVRAVQLETALDWAVAGYPGGLVVAGDLNATASDAALAPLALSPTSPTFHGARAGATQTGGMAIDHCVLWREGQWSRSATGRALDRPSADGWFPSDHAAVVLDLTHQDRGAPGARSDPDSTARA